MTLFAAVIAGALGFGAYQADMHGFAGVVMIALVACFVAGLRFGRRDRAVAIAIAQAKGGDAEASAKLQLVQVFGDTAGGAPSARAGVAAVPRPFILEEGDDRLTLDRGLDPELPIVAQLERLVSLEDAQRSQGIGEFVEAFNGTRTHQRVRVGSPTSDHNSRPTATQERDRDRVGPGANENTVGEHQ